MSKKGFKLIEAITSLDGVKATEVYQKSTGENVWDILVSTENGRLVEGTLASKEDLALLQEYLKVVVSLGDSNLRSYPNVVGEEDIDYEQPKS
jgi:hypothetical protein